MNRLRCVFVVARTEYLKWLTDPRVIIVGVLLVFMRSLAVEPLLERAVKFGEKLNILEPFVAVGNSGMLVMLMPCVFLVLISDYPKMTGSTLFFIRRTGKTNWFWGQVLFFADGDSHFSACGACRQYARFGRQLRRGLEQYRY